MATEQTYLASHFESQNSADIVMSLLRSALAAATAYANLQARASQENREIDIDDLKSLRSMDNIASADLDAAIKAHG